MKKALNITIIVTLLAIAGLIVYLKVISEGKSIYISTGFGSDVIAKVDGEEIKKAELLVLLADAKKEYEEMFGPDIWDEKMGDQEFDEFVIDTIRARLVREKCMQVMAGAKGIVLSTAEEQNVVKAAKEYISLLSKDQIRLLGADQKLLEQMYTEALLSERLFNDLTLEIDTEVSEDEARVITIQYIRVMEKNDAVKIRKRIENGESFMNLVKENNALEYEYVLKRGQVEESLEQAAFALATGELSDVVETSMGCYILLCVNDYDKVKTAANKEQIIIERKLRAFNEIFDKYEEEKYAEYHDTSWTALNVRELPKFDTSFNQIYEKYFK